MKEALAKDILCELEPHLPCGRFVTKKVGRRGWERPRVCISARLYKQYRVRDPWDPASKAMDEDIGLGSVALRLGENRRQPAPHLKPREPKKKMPSLPAAPKARKKPVSLGQDAKRSASVKRKPEVDPEIDRLRAAAAEKRQRAEKARSWPRRRKVEPVVTEAERGAVPPLPVRPEARGEGAEDSLVDGAPVSASLASRAPARRTSGRQRAGRFRMQSTSVQSAPVVRSVDTRPASPEVETPVKETVAPPRCTATGGLDDLFGAAVQAGRLQMSKPTPSTPEGAEE